MKGQQTGSPEWLYPIPASGQICVVLKDGENGLNLPNLVSAEYALFTFQDDLLPSRGHPWDWAITVPAKARISTQPKKAPDQVAPQKNLKLHLQVRMQNGTTYQTKYPMALLISQEPSQEPAIRCDPELLYLTTITEITQVLKTALPEHPNTETLAQQVMTHQARPIPKPAPGIAKEETQKLADRLTRAAKENLPGESSACSVFRITYDDGCNYTGNTSLGITDRTSEIHGTKITDRSRPHPLAEAHANRMNYTITCLNSGLTKSDAAELRRRLTGGQKAMAILKECTIAGKEPLSRVDFEIPEAIETIAKLNSHDKPTGNIAKP